MKTLMLSVGLLLSVILAGCSNLAENPLALGTLLAADTKAADAALQSGEVESAVLSAELSNSELEVVISAFDDYAYSRSVLTDLARDPVALVASVGAIQAEHARLKTAYLSLRQVVADNWGEYAPADRAQLERWQVQAARLEDRYQRFVVAVRQELADDERKAAAVELLKVVAQIALVAA